MSIPRSTADDLLRAYAEHLPLIERVSAHAPQEHTWGWSYFYDDSRLHAPAERTFERDGQQITVGTSESDDGLMVWVGETAAVPRCEVDGEHAEFCRHFE